MDEKLSDKENIYQSLVQNAKEYASQNKIRLDNQNLLNIFIGEETLFSALIDMSYNMFYNNIEENSEMRPLSSKEVEQLRQVYSIKKKVLFHDEGYDIIFENGDKMKKENEKSIKSLTKELKTIEKEKNVSAKNRRAYIRKKIDNLQQEITDFESKKREYYDKITKLDNECTQEIEKGKSTSNDIKRVKLDSEDLKDYLNALSVDCMDEIGRIRRNKETFIHDPEKFEICLEHWVNMMNYDNPEYAKNVWRAWIQNAKYGFSHTETIRNFMINLVSPAHGLGKSNILRILGEEICKISDFTYNDIDLGQTLNSTNKWPECTGINVIDEIKNTTKYDAELLKKVLSNNPISINKKYVANNVTSINHSCHLSSSNFVFSISNNTLEGVDNRVCNLKLLGEKSRYKASDENQNYEADLRKLCHDLFYYAPFEKRDFSILDYIASNYQSEKYLRFLEQFKSSLTEKIYSTDKNIVKPGWLTIDNIEDYMMKCIKRTLFKNDEDLYLEGSKMTLAKYLVRIMDEDIRTDTAQFKNEAIKITYLDIFDEIDDFLPDLYKFSDKFKEDVVNFKKSNNTTNVESQDWILSPAYMYANDIVIDAEILNQIEQIEL